MQRRLRLRFRTLAVCGIGLFIVVMSAVFVAVVFGKFQEMARSNAVERFEVLSAQAAARLDQLLSVSSRFVRSQANSGFGFPPGGADRASMAVEHILLSALDTEPNAYGYYYGLANDEFVQAIGVRGDPRIVASLKAPPDSHYAIRVISGKEAQRVEHWRFLGSDRHLLANIEQPATYFPTTRPWYAGAMKSGSLFLTEPYNFASTNRPGLTLAAPFSDRSGAIAADVSLDALNRFLASMTLPPNGAILILDKERRILAYRGAGERAANLDIEPLARLADIKADHLAPIDQLMTGADGTGTTTFQAGGVEFLLTRFQFSPVPGNVYQVAMSTPIADYSGPIDAARRQVLLITLIMLAVLIPVALIGSKRLTESLAMLAQSSERIKQLDFSERPTLRASIVDEVVTLGEAQLVMHDSIKQRTADLSVVQEKLTKLVQTGLSLSREQNRETLLRNILMSGRDIAHATAGTFYLVTEQQTLKFAMLTNEGELPAFEMALYDPKSGEPNDHYVSVYAAVHNKTVLIDDVYSETRFDLSGTKAYSEQSGFRTISMLTVPLSPGGGQVIGVLQYLNATDPKTDAVIPFDPELVAFVEALAAQSAVTLQNQQLLQSQIDLMDSMITIIGGAIDAKSPYTGGHCERVPELAMMLVQEAQKTENGALAEFSFKTDDEWREFRIGAWLHDCGKVTTPEYVVDKATKLETISNRIHEVRTRFEVLLRDADIMRLKTIAAGGDVEQANERFQERQSELFDDFAFIAATNLGGEFLAAENVERVRRIGAQTWLRHFDDRLGLAHDELIRYQDEPVMTLPVAETLLADKPHHLIKRGSTPVDDPKHGFKMTVPEHLYNFGELHNLCIQRGTLTEEERFKINDHIVQTIVMLNSMPFPAHMRRVPEYAGTHHETLIGTGYPKRLEAQDLSVPSRVMAIADIFEALTASDRPYKKAKTLSESIKILSFFKKDKHIDPDLFDLFLTSGVYLRYAERFLKPEQIDTVKIEDYLG